MATALLKTKLYIPQPRSTVVARPRLSAKLDAGLERKLTLVSAPAGFGKSTALGAWAAATARPVGWLTLDQNDNAPSHFWAYIGAALQSVLPNIRGLESVEFSANPRSTASVEEAIIDLLNSIATQTSERVALVVDDIHVVTEPLVWETFWFMLDRLPPQLHVTLAGRALPPWPLARPRVRGELIEVDGEELRFTVAETAAFLNEVMGLALSTAEVGALESRTEGWIAGLQMAALSMNGREDIAGFIDTLSGSHRFIMDYLLEEVLDRQPAPAREFLLTTSILSRLTPPLCDAVTGVNGSQDMLRRLEQANLFLTPLDDTRTWYRYHQLFADLLSNRLRERWPERIAEFHLRASEWHEQNGVLAEAMNHAFAAGDVDRQVHLIANNALTLAYQGKLTTLMRWLANISADVGEGQPWFCLSQAWVIVFAGHLDEVEKHLQAAELALKATEDGPRRAERARIAGHIAAIRGYVAGLRGDWPLSHKYALAALDLLPDSDMMARGWTTLLLAVDLRAFGDLAGAAEAFATAAAISRAGDFPHLTADILWEHSEVQRARGKLHAALESCQIGLELAATHRRQHGRSLPPAGYTYVGIAAVYYEWNELDKALKNGEIAVRLCKRWGMADAIVRSHLLLARILQTAGDERAAREALQTAGDMAALLSPNYRTYVENATAQFHIVQGDFAPVEQWVQARGLHANANFALTDSGEYMLFARLLIAQHLAHRHEQTLTDAQRILTRVEELAADAGANGALIQVLILKAICLSLQNRASAALDALTTALHHAAPAGYIRPFVDEVASVVPLLRKVATTSDRIAAAHARTVLAAIDERSESTQTPALAEPLTEREMEVLRLLPTSLTTKEIAAELTVAPSTIRTHIKGIYGKLNVHRRTEAVDKAKKLELL